MKMSSFRVRTRLIAGFALLLLMTAFIGVLGVSELSKLNHTAEQLATSDWETARTAISLRSNIRSIAARPDGPHRPDSFGVALRPDDRDLVHRAEVEVQRDEHLPGGRRVFGHQPAERF